MKTIKTTKYLVPVSLLAVGLMFGACSDSGGPVGAPKLVEIQGNDNMKYDVTEIQVNRGQPVKVTIKNAGTMPKESMGHNFVLLKKGTDVSEFLMAAATQARNAYVPPQYASSVLASSKLLGPGESDIVEFIAPGVPGKYDYCCSFPGHAPAGMKGTLIVN